jgi:hypothetical protein
MFFPDRRKYGNFLTGSDKRRLFFYISTVRIGSYEVLL